MKPVILLDCDGPLSRFTESYLLAVFAETGVRIDVSAIDRWDIHKTDAFQSAAQTARTTPNELKSLVVRHIVSEGFCERIGVQPGAQEAVARLREIGDVYVVTSPWDSSKTWMYERLHWVAKHFDIPRGHVIQCGRKHLIRGDVFVDDKLSHVVEWSAAWPQGKAILFDMHHNRGETAKEHRGGWEHAIAAAQAAGAGSQEKTR